MLKVVGKIAKIIYLQFSIIAFAFAEGLQNPIQGVGSIGDLLIKIAQVISYVSTPFLVIAYIYVGFLFVSAQGNTDKLKKAKSMFIWTTVAAFLILGAPVIIEILQAAVDTLKQ